MGDTHSTTRVPYALLSELLRAGRLATDAILEIRGSDESGADGGDPVLRLRVVGGLLVDLETHLNTEVGRRIRTKRHESELTLKQLANRTGLSVSLISQIELGKSAASMSTMHKLAAALGVRMTYFFETL